MMSLLGMCRTGLVSPEQPVMCIPVRQGACQQGSHMAESISAMLYTALQKVLHTTLTGCYIQCSNRWYTVYRSCYIQC